MHFVFDPFAVPNVSNFLMKSKQSDEKKAEWYWIFPQ